MHNNLGLALQAQGKLSEAMNYYREAIRLKSDLAEAHNNLGVALREQDRSDESVASYREALRLKPDYAEAHSNLGLVLHDKGEFDEAMTCHRHALRSWPDLADAHVNLSLELLALGQFAEGWQEYAWRSRTSAFQIGGPFRPSLLEPFWDGSLLQGRSILLQAEQGLGDTIQFVRYAALLKDQGAGKVMLACSTELGTLMSSYKAIDQIVTETQYPPFDVGAFLLDMPRFLGTTAVERIPSAVPYLDCEPERCRAAQEY